MIVRRVCMSEKEEKHAENSFFDEEENYIPQFLADLCYLRTAFFSSPLWILSIHLDSAGGGGT